MMNVEPIRENEKYLTRWKIMLLLGQKAMKKTGVAANLKRKLSEGFTTSRLTTETTHINENLGLSYDTYVRHVFEYSGDLKCFNFERTHYDFSQANQMAMGNCILTDDGLKLAYTIAKGQDARFNSITQGIQKINCQW